MEAINNKLTKPLNDSDFNGHSRLEIMLKDAYEELQEEYPAFDLAKLYFPHELPLKSSNTPSYHHCGGCTCDTSE